MRKRMIWLVAAMMLIWMVGGLFASNMGFRLNFHLQGPGPTLDGTCAVSLPYHRRVDIVTAEDLLNDIPGATGVGFHNKQNNLGVRYTGLVGSPPNFPLVDYEGYYVSVGGPVDYLIVGTHNPGLQVNFLAGGLDGTCLWSYPYHSTLAFASDALADIPNATGIGFLNKQNNLGVRYTGIIGSPPDFPLIPGQAYFVTVTNDTAYIPPHY